MKRSILGGMVLFTALLAMVWTSWRHFSPVRGAAPVPAQFEDVLVANVIAPTGLAFTPDGRMLITRQYGQLRIYQNGALLATPALDLTGQLCLNNERGLLGVAVDPQFSTNNFIYLFYTFRKIPDCIQNDPTNPNNPVNRVSRFTLGSNNVVNLQSEVVLVDNIHSSAGNHNAGDLHFGKDGYLYVSVGDGGADYNGDSGYGGDNNAARDMNVLVGKILRITRDGQIPPANPFQGANTARCNVTGKTTTGNVCQEIFATGLRNPFRIAFDPNSSTTRFFINDVGQNVWEEINEGVAGADYGWNLREGHCFNGSTSNCGAPPAGLTNPIFDYPHTGDCGSSAVAGNSITGGAFVPNGIWPAEYNGAYLFGEYVCGKIFKLTPKTGGGYTADAFATGLGSSSAVAMVFGPYQSTQALYYTTYAGGGQIRRISYSGTSNRAPVAAAKATPASGAAPLDVVFDATGSSDPDGDALSYSWNFGDSTSGSGAKPSHRYPTIGTYNAVVTVTDGRGGSNTATVRIDVGNTPPVPVIASPTADKLFRVGETITLTGSATDQQEGALAASRLTWEILLHHNNDHTHPYFGPQSGNNLTFKAPAPEDLPAAVGSFLEIRLTAVDAQGLKSTIVRNLAPRKVNVTFATNPSGLLISANGTQLTGPATVVSWDGYPLTVTAANQTYTSGQQWNFANWSDGGAQSHTIVTPATAATYTANFTSAGGGGVGAGLTGSYYDNQDFTNLRSVRTDANVNFDWGTAAPAGVNLTSPDSFSVRWTGKIQAPVTGTYTFTTSSDDGVRLYVNNQLVINYFEDHAVADTSGTINLTAGASYDIRMDFYENGGEAVAKLFWSYPGQTRQVVPTARLFPPTAVANGTGLSAYYYDNQDFTSLRTVRTDETVNFDWGATAPAGAGLSGSDTFSVRWLGKVQAPVTGAYTFSTFSDDGVRLFVNDQLVIDHFTDHAIAQDTGGVNLIAGASYDIRMEYYEKTGEAVAKLYWSYPGQALAVIPKGNLFPVIQGTGTGLTAYYYDNQDFSTLKTNRTDATVNFNWGNAAPAGAGLTSPDTFSVRWVGKVQAPVTGAYTFTTLSDDGVRLYVNNQLVVDHFNDHAETSDSGVVSLTGGESYDLRMEYYEATGGAVAKLFWAYPGQTSEIIPTNRLSPQMLSGGGAGLTASYFDNPDFTGLRTVRTDDSVNFDWAEGPPAGAGLANGETFSVRWEGLLQAPVTGSYTFTVTSDDGVRLYLNNQLLIEDVIDHAVRDQSAVINLTAGASYAIRMEYHESTGQAVVKLSWSYPGQLRQVIPSLRLIPASATASQTAPLGGAQLFLERLQDSKWAINPR
jgi:glucose/arabinose dehydrogenase